MREKEPLPQACQYCLAFGYHDEDGYLHYYTHQGKYVNEMGSPATRQTHPKREVYQGGEGHSIMLVAPGDYINNKDPKGPPTERSSPLGIPLGQEERSGWYGSLYLLFSLEDYYGYHTRPLTMGYTPWLESRAHGRVQGSQRHNYINTT